MKERRVLFAVVLGVFAFPLAALADGLLGGSRSPTPPATFAIVAVYVVTGQFLVAIKGRGLGPNRPMVIGMATPCLMGGVLVLAVERWDVFLNQGAPLLAVGLLGPLAGAWLAGVSRG